MLWKRALYNDMSRYVCCTGYMPCSGRCGESRCPEFLPFHRGEATLIAVDLTLLVTVALTIFKFVVVKQGCDFILLGPLLLCAFLLLIAFGILRKRVQDLEQ